MSVMEVEPESLIASCAALRIEAPIGLGAPFCVSGRTIPTRTGPVPIVSPTDGAFAGRAGEGAGPPASFGISRPAELQPASVKVRPPPSKARLVTPRPAAGCSAANLIPTPHLSRAARANALRRHVRNVSARQRPFAGCPRKLWHFHLRLAMRRSSSQPHDWRNGAQ